MPSILRPSVFLFLEKRTGIIFLEKRTGIIIKHTAASASVTDTAVPMLLSHALEGSTMKVSHSRLFHAARAGPNVTDWWCQLRALSAVDPDARRELLDRFPRRVQLPLLIRTVIPGKSINRRQNTA